MSAPDPTPAVPPALTPEEWRAFDRVKPSSDRWPDHAASRVDNAALAARRARVEPAEFAAALPPVMALANAALPDDSPHKLTRADLAALRDAVASYESDRFTGHPSQWEELQRMQAALAKLAALLPPEPPDRSAVRAGAVAPMPDRGANP